MTAPALSRRWAASHHRLLGRTTDKAVRLALALGAVKSAVRVVDRSLPPMIVDWSAHDPDAVVKSASYTDFKGGTINLNPGPILDEGIGHGAALDVVIGFGLHEAGHSQESRDRHKHLIKQQRHPNGKSTMEVPAFSPMRVAAYLWNLVEDVRMEQATARSWPGFAAYFDAVLDYMWADMRKRAEMPTEYGPTLTDKLRVVYLACRYPGRLTSSPALDAEIAWWQAWQHDYLTDVADTPTTIRRGLDYLAEDMDTKLEMDEQARVERREREVGERLKAQLDRLIREGIKGGFEVCVSDNGEIVPLDAETAEEVHRLVRENLIETTTIVTTAGVSNAPLRVRKPEETPASRRAYVGRPDAEAEALRAALVFRASAPQHDEKLLKSGSIDDDELYRWGAGDMRVYSERVIEAKPDVFMGLLVDASGSMYGEKLRIAQRLAQLFVWAAHDQEGIETAVWAHTADVTDATDAEGRFEAHGPTEVYRLWQKGDPLSRLGIIAEIDHANNRDGAAIEYVSGQIALAGQPEKVLLVLSDGLPSAEGYGGRPARQHVRAVQRWAMARGVRVIQIAIDNHDLRPHDQAAMFGTEGDGWIGFRDYASLPRQITALMSRYM